MIGGGTPMTEVTPILGPALAEAQGSLSTWLLDKFGRVPQPGEVYREGSLEFVVRRIRRGKIFEVAVHQLDAAKP